MVESIVPFSILVLLINTKYTVWSTRMYDSNDNAHGVRFSANEKFIVGAFNAYQRYALRSLSKSTKEECRVDYLHPKLYVYSLVAVDLPNITTNNSDLAAFVQIAENMTASLNSLKSVVLSVFIVNINVADCDRNKVVVRIVDKIIWSSEIHQEYMLLKVDPQQKYVYGFTDIAVFSYELATNVIDQFVFMNDTVFWKNLTDISVRSFDLTNEWALLAAYATEFYHIRSYYLALLLELHPLRFVDVDRFHNFSVDTSETVVYNLYYDLSVSIAPDNSLAAIGAPSLNSVTLCQITRSQNDNQSDWIMVLENETISTTLASGNNGFGRSVAWLDDEVTNALVVLIDTIKDQIWSPSQVRVYPNISISSKMVNDVPDFVFPNSQQRILDGFYLKKLSILQLATVTNNLLLLFDNSYVFYIPSAPFGLCSVMVNNNGGLYNNVFEARTCVGGSYKNKSSPGPCISCPTQTKSILVNDDKNLTAPISTCTPCKKDSFCPLAATGEVNLSNVASYAQTFVYPDGGTTDNYDDLLLQNFLLLE